MPWLTAPLFVAGILLVVAGAQKAVDPAPASGGLRALGLPSSPKIVRALAGVELCIGVTAIMFGHPLAVLGMAGSYAAFTAYVLMAMRARTDIASCGCFGREDTPPSLAHVGLNVLFAAVGLAGAVGGADPASAITAEPLAGAGVAFLAVVGAALALAAYTLLPRLLGLAREMVR